MTDSDRNPKRVALELFVLSALSLYLELLIIRWMSADIRAFTVFRTFPLITCFVGLGVGFALRKQDIFCVVPAAIMQLIVTLKLADFTGVCLWGFPTLSNFQWINLVGITPNLAYMVVFMLMIILLLAAPFGVFVAIGCRLGLLFDRLPSLQAYSLNLAGAIAGSAVFPILSFLGFPPWQLLLPAAAILVFMVWQTEQKINWKNIAVVAAIPVLFLVLPGSQAKPLLFLERFFELTALPTLWSPYQRIDVQIFSNKVEPGKPADNTFRALELSVNRAFYQSFLELYAPHDIPKGTEVTYEAITKDYELPFLINNPKNCLIVGCGTGQNVSSALHCNVKKVDAVDIDPVILELGRRFNSDYHKPEVNLVCDDARHFFSATKEKYDVIDFSTLDSHTVAGLGSSVRVDTYVYTKESFKQALRLLNPENGLFVLSFTHEDNRQYVTDRLQRTLTEAAGYQPKIIVGKAIGMIFVLGPAVKDGKFQIPQGYQEYKHEPSEVRVLTDDWPYLYVQTGVVDWPYLAAVAEMLLIMAFAGRRFLFSKNDSSMWQMFFMGAAFMLLELYAISFLSLLYGSTWITSALVINGILIMIFLGNLLVLKVGAPISSNQKVLYAVLFGTIAISYFLPSTQVLESSVGMEWLTYPVVTALTVLPMGVASLIFSSAFAKMVEPPKALAFNLMGSVVGGLMEYWSNYLGIKNLVWVAAFLYALSLIGHLNSQKTAIPPEGSASSEPPAPQAES